MQPGLVQAIHRLAWEVRRAQDEIDQPIIRANPWVLGESNRAVVEFCETQRTREEQARWDLIEEIHVVVVETYGIGADKLNEAVGFAMDLQDEAEEELLRP